MIHQHDFADMLILGRKMIWRYEKTPNGPLAAFLDWETAEEQASREQKQNETTRRALVEESLERARMWEMA